VIIGILLTVVHVLVCLFLIIVVLLQSGKAADLAGAFGGQGSQTAFGPRGSATLLSKATTISAILFMITSMSLSIVAQRGQASPGTLLDRKPLQKSAAPLTPGVKPVQKPAPVVPAPAKK
jgi:preprotein translocase subunit SecG